MNKIPNYFDMIKSNADDTSKAQKRKQREGSFVDSKIGYQNHSETKATKTTMMKKSQLKSNRVYSTQPVSTSHEQYKLQHVPTQRRMGRSLSFASRDGKRLDAFANSCPHLGSPFDLATIEH
jgi:hypothetical protein